VWSLLLAVGLNVPVVGRDDPIGIHVDPLSKWDLKVGVVSIVDVAVWSGLI